MITLDYAYITYPGDRSINEDAVGFVATQEKHCFVLCDGLGGHGMGDEASFLVKESILKDFTTQESLADFLPIAFTHAQETLLIQQANKHAQQKMKTTAVCMVCDMKKLYVGFVGDSRFYAFCKKGVAVQTADHSVPYRLYLSKMIQEEEIRTHPDRNILLRIMGVPWNESQYEILKPMKLKSYQGFLLCSDGFWELITEEEMCELLQGSNTAAEWLSKMQGVVAAHPKKDKDNFSAIAVLVHKR